VNERDRTRTLQAAALCLGYPDDELRAGLPLLHDAAGALPRPAAEPLRRFLRALEGEDLTQHYVETFDLRRRCCLYLTYYAFGDTRKRGMALLRFRSAYRDAGLELRAGELPDHLAVVCEAAARAPQLLHLLAEYRAGVEVLRIALAEQHSPYADVLDTVRAALPPVSERDLDRAFELARSGPPAEEVGLEPFAPPEYMGARR
jgi:nitrate reductase delta subunit